MNNTEKIVDNLNTLKGIIRERTDLTDDEMASMVILIQELQMYVLGLYIRLNTIETSIEALIESSP